MWQRIRHTHTHTPSRIRLAVVLLLFLFGPGALFWKEKVSPSVVRAAICGIKMGGRYAYDIVGVGYNKEPILDEFFQEIGYLLDSAGQECNPWSVQAKKATRGGRQAGLFHLITAKTTRQTASEAHVKNGGEEANEKEIIYIKIMECPMLLVISASPVGTKRMGSFSRK